MQKPNGYDSAPSKTFSGGNMPPAGAYILGIIKAEVKMSRNDNEMLEISLDIASGEYKGFYRALSDNIQHDCLLKHRRLTDTEKSIPYLKGDIKAIEESNEGFNFNFDEKTLRGKLVGAMLREEEYERTDGSIGTKISIAFLCSTKTAMGGTLKIPPKKEIDTSRQAPVNQSSNATSDDSLPF